MLWCIIGQLGSRSAQSFKCLGCACRILSSFWNPCAGRHLFSNWVTQAVTMAWQGRLQSMCDSHNPKHWRNCVMEQLDNITHTAHILSAMPTCCHCPCWYTLQISLQISMFQSVRSSSHTRSHLSAGLASSSTASSHSRSCREGRAQ